MYSQKKWAKIGQRLGLLAYQSEGEVRADALSSTQKRDGERRANKRSLRIRQTFIYARTEAVDPDHHCVARKASDVHT